MQGGMTMVGDMFNHGLKAKVDNLCTELSRLLAQQPFVPPAPAIRGASRSGGTVGVGRGHAGEVRVPVVTA